MAKINSLSDAQEKALISHREYWLKIGLSTELSDRATTERIITDFYQRRGLKQPYFWWCDGPMVAQLVMNILSDGKIFKKISGANLRANLRDNLRDNLWANLRDNLRANLGDNLGANLGDNLRDNLRDNLGDNLGDNLWDNLRDNQLQFISTYFWGSLDSYWIAYYLYPEQWLDLKYKIEDSALLVLWADLAKSTFWWWPFENIVVLSERPLVINKDERGRLHCETGPACSFRDSWAVWYLDGQSLSEEIWQSIVGKEMAFAEIMAIENADIRALALKYNPEAMISSGSKLIDISKRGNALYLIEGQEVNTFLEEPEIWFLKMECPTGRSFIEGVEPGFARKSRKADECQARALGLTITQYNNLSVEG